MPSGIASSGKSLFFSEKRREEIEGEDTEYEGNCTDSTTASSGLDKFHSSALDSSESATEDERAALVSVHLDEALGCGRRPLMEKNGAGKPHSKDDLAKVPEEESEIGTLNGLVAFATDLAGSVADVAAAAFSDSKDMKNDGVAPALPGVGIDMPSWGSVTLSLPQKSPEGAEERPRTPGRSPSCRRRSTSASKRSSSQPKRAAKRYRIAFVVNGSEGDVRPLVAMARALQDMPHHAVRILTNSNMVHLCIEHGVDAVPVFADSRAVIQNCGGLGGGFMEAVRRPAKMAEKWMRDHKGDYVQIDDALEAYDPSGIVVGAMAVGVCLKYETAKQVPVIPVFLSRPWLDEEAFNFVADKLPPRPSFFAMSEALDRTDLPFKFMMRTGAWVLSDVPTVEDLSPGGKLNELKQFLEAGPPPVAVGWGSMMAEGLLPADMLDMALRALMHTDRRGVILGGWAELDRLAALAASGRLPSRHGDGGKLAAFAQKQVCFVASAPHEWLFPRCCCIIHHGGIGTTHACLRAGKPSIITPICADQFVNSESINKLKVGVGFSEGLPQLQTGDLTRAIRVALGDAVQLQVEMIGRKLRREESQAISRAAEMIDGYLRGRIKAKNGQWVRLKPSAKKAPPATKA